MEQTRPSEPKKNLSKDTDDSASTPQELHEVWLQQFLKRAKNNAGGNCGVKRRHR